MTKTLIVQLTGPLALGVNAEVRFGEYVGRASDHDVVEFEVGEDDDLTAFELLKTFPTAIRSATIESQYRGPDLAVMGTLH